MKLNKTQLNRKNAILQAAATLYASGRFTFQAALDAAIAFEFQATAAVLEETTAALED